jgi:hypothetical protein
MKRSAKKISLSRETVRLLTEDEARRVAGGITQLSCNMVCGFSQPTVCLTGTVCLDTAACP